MPNTDFLPCNIRVAERQQLRAYLRMFEAIEEGDAVAARQEARSLFGWTAELLYRRGAGQYHAPTSSEARLLILAAVIDEEGAA